MAEYRIDGMIQIQPRFADAGAEAVRIIESGKAVEIIVQEYDEAAIQKRRTSAQNRLYFSLYQRIAKTLHGGDEQHARRECKLKIGCRILRRDSEDFASTYDLVIRPLDYESKLRAMDLISVSSIMSVKQGTEYIKKIIQMYTEQGCYFMDIEGTDQYTNYREAQ